jgi:hypothetical protein
MISKSSHDDVGLIVRVPANVVGDAYVTSISFFSVDVRLTSQQGLRRSRKFCTNKKDFWIGLQNVIMRRFRNHAQRELIETTTNGKKGLVEELS